MCPFPILLCAPGVLLQGFRRHVKRPLWIHFRVFCAQNKMALPFLRGVYFEAMGCFARVSGRLGARAHEPELERGLLRILGHVPGDFSQ